MEVLCPETAKGLSAERFTREIRLAAALQDPHIVNVLATGQTDDVRPSVVHELEGQRVGSDGGDWHILPTVASRPITSERPV